MFMRLTFIVFSIVLWITFVLLVYNDVNVYPTDEFDERVNTCLMTSKWVDTCHLMALHKADWRRGPLAGMKSGPMNDVQRGSPFEFLDGVFALLPLLLLVWYGVQHLDRGVNYLRE